MIAVPNQLVPIHMRCIAHAHRMLKGGGAARKEKRENERTCQPLIFSKKQFYCVDLKDIYLQFGTIGNEW